MHLDLPGALNEDTRPSTERQEPLTLPGGVLGKFDPEGGCLKEKKKIYGWEVSRSTAGCRERMKGWEGKKVMRGTLDRAVRDLGRTVL